jgi:hypothetical protein
MLSAKVPGRHSVHDASVSTELEGKGGPTMKSCLLYRHLLLLPILVLGASTQYSGSGEHAYIGTKKCKTCHLKEWKSWSTTKMANSFDLLKPGTRKEKKVAAGLDPEKDYTADPECLPCHTVGYGETGGFVDLATTPNHAGVGCEMCHGPGGTYIKKEYMSLQNKEYKRAEIIKVGLVYPIVAETCASVCHNTKSPFVGDDYVFDFEKRRNEGTHEKYPMKYQH